MNRNLNAAWPARALGLALAALTLGAAFAGAQTSSQYEASDADESAEAEEEEPKVQAPLPTPRPTRAAPRVFRVVRPGVIHAEPNVESDDVQRSGEQGAGTEKVLASQPAAGAKTPASTAATPVSGATAQQHPAPPPCMANNRVVECSPEVQKARAFNREFERLNNIPPQIKTSDIHQMAYYEYLLGKNPGHFKTPADTATTRASGAAQQHPAPPPCMANNRVVECSPEVQKARAFNREFERLNNIPPQLKTSDIPQMAYYEYLIGKNPGHFKTPGAQAQGD